MFEFCKRPHFFDFWLNLNESKIKRAVIKRKHLLKMALGTAIIDYLLNNKEDMPSPFQISLGMLAGLALTSRYRRRSLYSLFIYSPVWVFSVSVSELEGKGKEKLIRMKWD